MAIEHPDEHLLVLLCTLSCGKQESANLSRTQIKEFISHFKQGKNYVTTTLNETYGFNPMLISNFRVLDLYQKEYKVVHTEILREETPPRKENEIAKEESMVKEDELIHAYSTELGYFKIDCVCGATYTVGIAAKTTRGNCNKCKDRLYVDRSKPKVETRKGLAWIMTNKYLVTSEMMNATEPIKQNLY